MKSPVMPNFVDRTRLIRHDANSALISLDAIGVPESRVVLEPAGPGPREGSIQWQSPQPGETIGRDGVRLGVAGVASFEALPYPLRERSREGFAIDRLLNVCDQPLLKLRYQVREGGSYLRLRRGDYRVAARWISDIFQIDLKGWPKSTWFALASLLPALHRLAGTERGLRLAMERVFGLPVGDVRLHMQELPLRERDRTQLGRQRSSLGVDAVAGVGLQARNGVELTFGPVPVDTYLVHTGDVESDHDWGELRRRIYRMVLPAELVGAVSERWVVGDPEQPTALDRQNPARLGIDSYLAPVLDGGAS